MKVTPLSGLGLAQLVALGAISSGYGMGFVRDDLTPTTQRAIARSNRQITHIVTEKPKGKRARRRARGKAKP